VFVFGGFGLYEVASGLQGEGEIRMGYLRDLWALDLATGAWTCADDLLPPPDARGAASTSAAAAAGQPLRAEASGHEIHARNGHGLLVLGGAATAATFGGYTGSGFLNGVEVFRTDWAEVGVHNDEDEGADEEDGGDGEEEDDEEEEEDLEAVAVAEEALEDAEAEAAAAAAAGAAAAEPGSGRAAGEEDAGGSVARRCGGTDAEEEEEADAALAAAAAAAADDDNGDDDDDDGESPRLKQTLRVAVRMWEFGQNDPKRDSGSKLVRLGLASTLKVADYFGGIVLNAEAAVVVSPADAALLLDKGVGGVNCSWNRLAEVPSRKLGKPANHRLLPHLLAANSVNARPCAHYYLEHHE
jgi:hypothetical protein